MATGLKHLVIGSDGRIGSALLKRLHEMGERADGTTRHLNGRPYLDIRHPKWIPPCDVAYICAAVIEDDGSLWETNVTGTLDVIRQLLEGGAFPVFLSSQCIQVRTDDYALSKIAVESAPEASRIGIVRLGEVHCDNLEDCLDTLMAVGLERRPCVAQWGQL